MNGGKGFLFIVFVFISSILYFFVFISLITELIISLLTKENFSDLLTFAGLQIINTFGNYKLDEFNHQTSDRLIIIAKK